MSKSFLNIVFSFLLLCSLGVKAQDYYQKDTIPAKKQEPKESFLQKTFFGGGLGLQFGNPTVIDVSPIIGYKITPKISAGIGFTYEYFNYPQYNFSTDIYGGSVFGRYYFTKYLFAHGELEYLNLQAYDLLDKRVDVESVLIGGGYINRFSRNAAFVAMILYNLTPSYYTPYQNPIIRLGVNIGF